MNKQKQLSVKDKQPSHALGCLESLHLDHGRFQLKVPEGEIPTFLLMANEAVCAGRMAEARDYLSTENIGSIERMLVDNPTRTDVMYVLARLLYDTQQHEGAEYWYKHILQQESHPLIYHHLATLCAADNQRLTEAVDYARQAYVSFAEDAGRCCFLAGLLMRTGRTQEGIDLFRRAVALDPDNTMIGGMLLWNLHYMPDQDPRAMFREYKRLATLHAPMHLARTSHGNDPDPERRIRVGFISPDFRNHSVGHAFEPLLECYRRECLETFGYGNVKCPDEMTERLAAKFDHYRPVGNKSFGEMALLVEQDNIDILVALGGHSEDNCLAVLAGKPAPIQVDYGGIDTSGMPQIDYRLTDTILDPPTFIRFYVETSVYLPGGLPSFRPPVECPLVQALPAHSHGHVTFGSFNNNAKINHYVISLWARVLQAIPDARMLLKFAAGADAGVREFYRQSFRRLGVAPERITIYGPQHPFAHLDLYNQVDMVLDTYPYNGSITTLEGLWMGVPPMTLTGDHYVSRVGLDILTRLGLDAFAACDEDTFVAKTRAFSGQWEYLAQIRAYLRDRMLQSPMCDPVRLSRELEAAFRWMWRRWCHRQDKKRNMFTVAPERHAMTPDKRSMVCRGKEDG